jgi:excisionase family DNA binding protein
VFLQITLLQFPQAKTERFGKGELAMNQYNKPYLTTADVAQLLGFSVRTITEWAVQWQDSGGKQGLPAFKMGRSWRFDRQQIQAHVDRLKGSKQLPFQPLDRKAATA